MVIGIEEKYGVCVGKKIWFRCDIKGIDLDEYDVLILLWVINNLMGNGVEGIKDDGAM
ncbi:hypothetical protein [Bacillus altitudinis]|uniref:hypothetical protein n=1 Tax=Bacillus altitudinis TaxID=293387 RepID=UPI0016436C01|nr:hypothetical protein [Bacillus altitudinis]